MSVGAGHVVLHRREAMRGIIVLSVVALALAWMLPVGAWAADSPISPPPEPNLIIPSEPEQWEIDLECSRFKKYWVDDNTEEELRWYEETCGPIPRKQEGEAIPLEPAPTLRPGRTVPIPCWGRVVIYDE